MFARSPASKETWLVRIKLVQTLNVDSYLIFEREIQTRDLTRLNRTNIQIDLNNLSECNVEHANILRGEQISKLKQFIVCKILLSFIIVSSRVIITLNR